MSVRDAGEKFGFTSRIIYNWLREGVVDGNRNLILENNKLRKDLETAYRIIGKLTAETSYPKR